MRNTTLKKVDNFGKFTLEQRGPVEMKVQSTLSILFIYIYSVIDKNIKDNLE